MYASQHSKNDDSLTDLSIHGIIRWFDPRHETAVRSNEAGIHSLPGETIIGLSRHLALICLCIGQPLPSQTCDGY